MLYAMKDKDKYSLKADTNTKYWKRTYPIWTQPKLTRDYETREFFVIVPSVLNDSVRGYMMFDDDSASFWHSGRGSDPWNINISSYLDICITGLRIKNRADDPKNVYPPTSVTLYRSNDGLTYTKIGTVNNSEKGAGSVWTANFDNSTYCNFYTIQITTGTIYCALNQIDIIATQEKLIEASPSDYDFMTEEKTYFAFRKGI